MLGNTPQLARLELGSLVRFKELLYRPPALVIETDDPIPFDLLGGTVKVAEEADLDQSITTDFGISDYTGKVNILKLSKKIKAETGKRFVLPRQGAALSSVVVKKQKLTELIFTTAGVFKTIWVQDFEAWNLRDYGRPAVEAHIGMLPPKVARQMINIAGGKTILDPFCGVGTILIESLVTGRQAIGSDINPKQIARTQKNLEWFGEKAELFIWDARKISEKVPSVDAIVTEADLGPGPGLNELYINCLKDWQKITKKVVIALPSAEVVDKARSIGYSLLAGPIVYSRPGALIKRHIMVFQNVTH